MATSKRNFAVDLEAQGVGNPGTIIPYISMEQFKDEDGNVKRTDIHAVSGKFGICMLGKLDAHIQAIGKDTKAPVYLYWEAPINPINTTVRVFSIGNNLAYLPVPAHEVVV